MAIEALYLAQVEPVEEDLTLVGRKFNPDGTLDHRAAEPDLSSQSLIEAPATNISHLEFMRMAEGMNRDLARDHLRAFYYVASDYELDQVVDNRGRILSNSPANPAPLLVYLSRYHYRANQEALHENKLFRFERLAEYHLVLMFIFSFLDAEMNKSRSTSNTNSES